MNIWVIIAVLLGFLLGLIIGFQSSEIVTYETKSSVTNKNCGVLFADVDNQ